MNSKILRRQQPHLTFTTNVVADEPVGIMTGSFDLKDERKKPCC